MKQNFPVYFTSIGLLLLVQSSDVAVGWMPAKTAEQKCRDSKTNNQLHLGVSVFDLSSWFSSTKNPEQEDKESAFEMPSSRTSVAEDKASILQVGSFSSQSM